MDNERDLSNQPIDSPITTSAANDPSVKPPFSGERVRLGEVCSIERAAVPTGDKVWLLNLDAVEKDSGRVLEKRHVDRSEVGPSTVPFSDKAVLYSKLRPNLNKVCLLYTS